MKNRTLTFSLMLVLAASTACTITGLPDKGWHAQLGKGCMMVAEDGTVIVESDGTSTNLASLAKELSNVIGSLGILGGGNRETRSSDPLTGGEGCRGVLDAMYETSE